MFWVLKRTFSLGWCYLVVINFWTLCFTPGPHSAVGNLSDCRTRSGEFDSVEIDHDIISTAILRPSADSRRVVVSYKRRYCTKY